MKNWMPKDEYELYNGKLVNFVCRWDWLKNEVKIILSIVLN